MKNKIKRSQESIERKKKMKSLKGETKLYKRKVVQEISLNSKDEGNKNLNNYVCDDEIEGNVDKYNICNICQECEKHNENWYRCTMCEMLRILFGRSLHHYFKIVSYKFFVYTPRKRIRVDHPNYQSCSAHI